MNPEVRFIPLPMKVRMHNTESNRDFMGLVTGVSGSKGSSIIYRYFKLQIGIYHHCTLMFQNRES